jgi:hypothetical protein
MRGRFVQTNLFQPFTGVKRRYSIGYMATAAAFLEALPQSLTGF